MSCLKKILVIQGHPSEDSFNHALAEAYKKGASESGAEVKEIVIRDLHFNLNLQYGYRKNLELEEDLVRSQELIKWADHLVFVYPSWWGTLPALLKGFIDRVFLPGFSFKYRKDSPMWDKLLTGRSARVIVTMDAPVWYYYLVQGKPGHNAMKKSILEYCGVKPVRFTNLSPIRKSSDEQRKKWLQQIEQLGSKMT